MSVDWKVETLVQRGVGEFPQRSDGRRWQLVVDLEIQGLLKLLCCWYALGTLMGWDLVKVDYSYNGRRIIWLC